MKSVGLVPVIMPLNEFDSFVKTELVRWEKMIADAGLQKE
jgi:hypothetical protein